MHCPFMRGVKMQLRIWQNTLAAPGERKQPDTFCFTLTVRRSRPPWLLSNGTSTLYLSASTSHSICADCADVAISTHCCPWLAVVVAILGNLIFRCLDSVNQAAEGLLKQSNDRLFAPLVGRVNLFAGRQWVLAHTDIVASSYDFAC